jgi:Kef-type K+ transport system membrane component KefB
VTSLHASEQTLAATLLVILLVILTGRLANSAARALGQPGVAGEIVAGLLLGPTVLGALAPGLQHALLPLPVVGRLSVIGQIGVILLMFQIGGETHLSRLGEGRIGRAALGVGLASIAVPFAVGAAFGAASHAQLAPQVDPRAYALFCGVALAITAMPVLVRILEALGLSSTDIGLIALCAAALNDAAGWVLLGAAAAWSTMATALTFGLLKLGVLLLLGLGCWLLRGWAGRVIAPRLAPLEAKADGLVIGVAAAFLGAILTSRLGVFALLGGFGAGLVFHGRPVLMRSWRERVSPLVLALFLPVFFTLSGLRTNLTGLSGGQAGWLILLIAAASAGKLVPAFLAGRALNLGARDALRVAVMMNTRGLMELIVLNVGLELGVLPPTVFSMMVVMAIVTTLATGPLLRILSAQPLGQWRPADA